MLGVGTLLLLFVMLFMIYKSVEISDRKNRGNKY